MAKEMIEATVLKKMLDDHPLTSEEYQQLGEGVFPLHGMITASITSFDPSPHKLRPNASKISRAQMDALEQKAILELQQEAKAHPIEPAATPSQTMLTPETTKHLVNRLYHSIHLTLAMDTYFVPLVGYQTLTVEDFWENRLTAQQRLRLQAWCDGYLFGARVNHWIKSADDKKRTARLQLHPVYLLSTHKTYTKKLGMTWINDLSLEELEAEKVAAISILPQFIINSYDFWRVLEPVGSTKQARAFREIPKNKPCPCSPLGKKKYKDCCFHRRAKAKAA